MIKEDGRAGERINVLRKAYGFDGHGGQSRFAEHIRTEIKALNHVFRGGSLSKSIAFRIVECFPGVTLEWLWGDRSGLTVQMAEKLGEARRSDDDE
jgi:hypothetical protein